MTTTTPAPATEPIVTALVVAADSGPWLQRCVAALLGSPQVAAVKIGDNASRDGEPQAVASRHATDPRLVLQVNGTNLGFGAAMNGLARGCTTPWLVLVNPDCELPPAALAGLIAVGQSANDVGLVGALIADEHGTVDPVSCRHDPTLARVLASLGLRRGEGINAPWPPNGGAQTVEAVSGAVMLVRRDVFEKLGGFDSEYFLHFEDLDLCRRARDAGLRVVLATRVRVQHAKGTSSRHRPVFVAWHKHRGLWRWLGKFEPRMHNPVVAVLTWCGIWSHFVARLPSLWWHRG